MSLTKNQLLGCVKLCVVSALARAVTWDVRQQVQKC